MEPIDIVGKTKEDASLPKVLGQIASTAQELAHFHSGDEDGIYLAYSDFHPYLLVDSSCMKELNQWFSKQLDTGPYRLVAEEGKSKCSWVNLDDVSNTLVRVAPTGFRIAKASLYDNVLRLREEREANHEVGESSQLVNE